MKRGWDVFLVLIPCLFLAYWMSDLLFAQSGAAPDRQGSGFDLTIPVTGLTAAAVIGFLGKQAFSMVKRKFDRWDKHIEDCAKKSVDNARLEEHVKALDDKVCDIDAKCGKMDDKLDLLLRRS